MLSKMNPKISVIFFTVLALAMTRLLPHWPNFTAVGAVAIFGGAVMRNSFKAISIPLIAIFISDLIINNTFYSAYYEGFVLFGDSAAWIYAGFILMAVISHFSIKSFKALPIIGTAIAGSVVFFLLTNFGSWLYNPMYTQDMAGLLTSFEAGLPFALNSLYANLAFSGILFTAYYVASEQKVSWLFAK